MLCLFITNRLIYQSCKGQHTSMIILYNKCYQIDYQISHSHKDHLRMICLL